MLAVWSALKATDSPLVEKSARHEVVLTVGHFFVFAMRNSGCIAVSEEHITVRDIDEDGELFGLKTRLFLFLLWHSVVVTHARHFKYDCR